jgi:hypothetical protein
MIVSYLVACLGAIRTAAQAIKRAVETLVGL